MSLFTRLAKVLGVLIGNAAIARLFTRRGWGLRPGESTRPLPGDGVIGHPDQTLTHGVDIDAAAVEVWPWIAQAGYGRGGWYTPRWVDKYIWRVSNPSLDRVDPSLQDISPGDEILDGPPGTAIFTVVDVTPAESLILHSQRHPVTGIPPDLAATAPGAYLDFSWVFFLEPKTNDTTRLLLRTRGIAHLGPISDRLGWLVWPTIDYLMSRSMLLGIKQRAETSDRLAST